MGQDQDQTGSERMAELLDGVMSGRLSRRSFMAKSAALGASASVLGGLSAPIFDAGRIRATITIQSEQGKQALNAYQSALKIDDQYAELEFLIGTRIQITK